jgi:uncharacterized protein YozE (UPF0346 family)
MEKQEHTLAYIKRLAKKLKKERGISHLQALEIVSISLGYSNWMNCRRSLDQQKTRAAEQVKESLDLSFTNWLRRHSNRNSPLGDLAKDMIHDPTWPAYDSLENFRSYLQNRNAISAAIEALEGAWKSYRAYLKRAKAPRVNKVTTKKAVSANDDQRKIVYVRNATSIPYPKRTAEKFVPGDKAWISWNGRKAIPVTVTEVDDSRYSFRIERPIKKAGSEHTVHLDEVRSTPELACANYVTW